MGNNPSDFGQQIPSRSCEERQGRHDSAGRGIGDATVQSNSLSLTADAYGRIEYAFRYFNAALFDDRLPPCILTFTRRQRTLGYFGAEFFASVDRTKAHEISLNPAYFETRGDRVTLSTLVHEQAHLARHEYGPANRRGGKGARGYHDLVWARLMLSVGLHPTADGTWHGKMTGYSVTHLIVEGGPFDTACAALLASGFGIRWRDHRHEPEMVIDPAGNDSAYAPPEPRSTRSKYTCPSCRQNAWAKHSAQLVCGACSRPLIRT